MSATVLCTTLGDGTPWGWALGGDAMAEFIEKRAREIIAADPDPNLISQLIETGRASRDSHDRA